MTPELQVAIFAAIMGPVIGFAGILWSVRNARRTSEKANQIAEQNAQAAINNATTAAKNATTQEFGVLAEAYAGTFERQDREIKALREAEEKREAFEHEVLEYVAVLVEHLDIVEELVPTPPGAPPRPQIPEAMRRRLQHRAA